MLNNRNSHTLGNKWPHYLNGEWRPSRSRVIQSYLPLALCPCSWAPHGTGWLSAGSPGSIFNGHLPARGERRKGQKVLASCRPMLLFHHAIHSVSFEMSWQREAGVVSKPRGLTPHTSRLSPGARKTNKQTSMSLWSSVLCKKQVEFPNLMTQSNRVDNHTVNS